MCALGHPEHMPESRTRALLPETSTSSMSPPSACIIGRMRSSTDSTRSLDSMTGPLSIADLLIAGKSSEQPACHEGTRRLLQKERTDERARALLTSQQGKIPLAVARLFAPGGFFQAELLHAVADLIAVQTEQRCGLRVVPAGAPERLHDELPLHQLEA